MKNKLKFSLVIPNFNGKKIIGDCLASIKLQTEKSFEVIVVDNGSTDGSIAFIKKNHPKVRIINLKKQLGFAVPVNSGIKAAKGEYIALVNNDVTLDKRWLSEIEKTFNRDKKIGFCACLLLNYNGKKIDSAGDGFSWWGRVYPIGRGQKPERYQGAGYVFGACAGAAVFKKRVFEKVGYLDKDFYAYFEDTDLSFRAQLAGFKCAIVPKAIAYHQGSATFGQKDTFYKRYIGDRNKDWVILKNYPTRYLLRNLPRLFLAKLKSIATDFWQGYLFANLYANFSVIVSLPKTMKKRAKIQHLRAVSDDYLDSIINTSHPRLK